MADLYEISKDYRDFIDINAKTYGKTVEFMKLTPTAQEYAKYIRIRDKINENTTRDALYADNTVSNNGKPVKNG